MPAIFFSNQTDYIAKMNTVGSEFAANTVAATVGGTTTLDCSLSSNFIVTMGAGNTTIAFSNVPTGAANTAFRLTVYIRQDGVGSRLVTWPGTVSWPGAAAPLLTTVASRYDIFNFRTFNSGTGWYGGTVSLNHI
jgi:hypothetical protein